MRIDVLLGEALRAPADVADRLVIVIDVLRAATTVARALANGAAAVRPFGSVEETMQARALAADAGSVLTAGERAMVRIPGFDLGNSPLEYSTQAVEGRTILFTTTNGTAALAEMHAARATFLAAFVNAGATVDAVARRSERDAKLNGVLVVCSGTDRRVALEDVVCAGRLVRLLSDRFPEAIRTDSATVARYAERPYIASLAQLADDAVHAHTLSQAGFAADVAVCFAPDSIPLAVECIDGALRPATAEAN